MTNRRQLLKTAIAAGATLLQPEILVARATKQSANAQSSETIYINPATGRDNNSGAKDAPLKSLPEVARRVNASVDTGARLEYKDIDAGFLEMIRTKTSEQSITFERDQSKRNYLHPVAGSDAAKIGAGLFLKLIS